MTEILIFAYGSQQQKALLELFNSYGLSNISDNIYGVTVTLHNMPVKIKVIIALIGDNVYSFIEQVVVRFDPKIILHIGLAESVKENVKVGDVVISSHIIDMTAESSQKGSHRFWPSINPSKELIEKAQSILGDNWYAPLSKIYSKPNVPKVFIAPTMQVDKRVAISEMDAILRQERTVTAVDMESASLVQAISHISPTPKLLVIRGVSSKFRAKQKKSTDIDYACDVAAAFSLEFIRRACRPSFATNSGGIDESVDKDSYTGEDGILSTPHTDSSGLVENDEVAAEDNLKFQRYRYAGEKHFHFFSELDSRQICLGISDYAKAIAHVLDHAKGEVCLSIMGHWGRGKTFLMSSVEKELQKSDLNSRYRVIWFSAWKYKTFPEVWVYLYQAFAEASLNDGWFHNIPRTFRMNMKKTSIWPIFAAIISLNFIILPFFDKVLGALGILAILASVLGVIGLMKVMVASRGIAKTAKTLSEKYLHPTNHEEKLGLQASIGKDLKYLITGWFDKVNLGVIHFVIYAVLVVITALVIHVSLAGERVIIHGIPLRPQDYVVNIMAGLWIIGAIVVPIWFLCGGRKENKILLIVDDLDRCPSGQILDIVESIKLLLEDKDISKYVQIAMLVEYEMLKEAILSKYKISNTEYTQERIIEDNIYKLFLATFTLPPLTSKEIAEVSDAYIVVPNTSSSESHGSGITNDEVAEPVPDDAAVIHTATSSEAIDDATPLESQHPKHVLTPSSHLDVVEQRAISTAVNDRNLWGKRRSVTPRAIQSLLLRYQLARYLLMLQGISYDPYQLSRLLIGNSVKWDERIDDSQDNQDMEDAIVAAVSRVSI